MILADKILGLRKKNGWSQEELAEKLNVTRQSISKWEGAMAIPDINKIIDLAKLFGVTTDYLLKDDIVDTILSNDDDNKVRKVSLQSANNYLSDSMKYSKQVGLGVVLCILSPALLLFLGATPKILNSIGESLATSLGLIALFILVCSAIMLFILAEGRMRKHLYLTKEEFELEYGVASIIKEKKEEYINKFNIGLALSIGAIILGALPLIVTAICEVNDSIIIYMIDLLLIIVSVAVYVIIILSTKKSAYDCLLREEEFDRSVKKVNEKNEKFGGFYWPIITAIYLGWSFITNDWNITWIVWPIAGLLFAGICAIINNSNE